MSGLDEQRTALAVKFAAILPHLDERQIVCRIGARPDRSVTTGSGWLPAPQAYVRAPCRSVWNWVSAANAVASSIGFAGEVLIEADEHGDFCGDFVSESRERRVWGTVQAASHRDTLAATAVLAGTDSPANARGYRHLLDFVRQQVPGRRCWAWKASAATTLASRPP